MLIYLLGILCGSLTTLSWPGRTQHCQTQVQRPSLVLIARLPSALWNVGLKSDFAPRNLPMGELRFFVSIFSISSSSRR